MELSDLKKSMSEMNEEELYALLKTSRQNRRISKRPPTVAKTTAKSAVAANPAAIAAAMSPELMKQLLAKLEGMKK